MKRLGNILYYTLVVGVSIIGILLLASMAPIPGNFAVKVVKSGSMEPNIKTGSLIAIFPASSYKLGDVITFGKDTKTQIPTTHRVVEVMNENGQTLFRTKGDANDVADPTVINKSDVRGRVILSVPYVGYILDFAKKPIGFGLLVGVPALSIIIDEILKIFHEVSKLRGSKKKRLKTVLLGFDGIKRHQESLEKPVFAVQKINPHAKMIAFIVVSYGSLFSLASIGGTISYFSDVEAFHGNTLTAGMVDFGLSGDSDIAGRIIDAASLPGKETFLITVTAKEKSLPLLYRASAELNDAASSTCQLMTLEVIFGDYTWNGLLADFHSPTTSASGDWMFSLSVPSSSSAKCSGNIVFDAFAEKSDGSAGVFSQRRLYAFEIYPDTDTIVPSADATTSQSILPTMAGDSITIEVEASSTPVIIETAEEVATTTPKILVPESETASSTPPVVPVVEENISTSTPPVITEPTISPSLPTETVNEPAPEVSSTEIPAENPPEPPAETQ